jgi:hypothetical protein
MKFRLAAAAAASGIAATALFSFVPAGAQEGGALPLTVDPASSSNGVFTVSGTGCLDGENPGVIDVFVDGSPLTNDDPQNPDLANPDGTWSFELSPDDPTVPLEPGVLEITATCTVNDGSGTEIVQYAPATHEIVAGTTTTAPPAPAPVAPVADPVVVDPTFTG